MGRKRLVEPEKQDPTSEPKNGYTYRLDQQEVGTE